MNKNIGTIDRSIRIIIGIILFVMIFFTDSIFTRFILAIFAIFSIYEGVSSWCVLYALLGRNTCPVKRNK